MNHPTKSESTTPPPTDMSVKVGGRRFTPALPVIDGAFPNALEQSFQVTLDMYTKQHIPLEPREGIETRERVLSKMGALCREWIVHVCAHKGVEASSGQLFTSGSYRLGVHEPGADIDTILVAPGVVRREDFFGNTVQDNEDEDDDDNTNQSKRDPNSLAERIRRHPDVTNFVPVEGAAVPILTFDWEGINIDLLFARLNSNTVPSDFNIDHDAVLNGVDSATEKSLNGPRVTNLVAAFVNGTPQRYQTFLSVVRCVRKWAKARGLYSNKMGYWGGVNINIAVAQCIQLYPNACPASLLRKFFLVFKTWRHPQPVLLTKPHDAGYGLPVWNAQTALRQVAPMITPAYPAMNSTLSVSRQTLQILQEEFNRGHEIVDGLWKEFQTDSTATTLNWSRLFEPSDFFIAYPNYLSLCIVGPSQLEAQAWAGFVESRLRKLVSDQLARSWPLKKIQLWPKKLEACIADDEAALLTAAQRQNSLTYFIGFVVDKARMRGDVLNAEHALQQFREWELRRFQPLIPGMDVLAKPFKVKELPRLCFEELYEGGKEEAMKKRRDLRNKDPARVEQRRKARLEALKAKMAELQNSKKKNTQAEEEEAEAAGTGEQEPQDRKRKRDEGDNGDSEDGVKREEEPQGEETGEGDVTTEGVVAKRQKDGQPQQDEPNDETNLLESAFDTVNAKTKEEAESERQKLLAGELMVGEEGEEDVDSDDEQAMYAADEGRQDFYTKVQKKTKTTNATADDNGLPPQSSGPAPSKHIRSLPVPEEQMEILRKLGCVIVSDEDAEMLGADLLPPWRGVGSSNAEKNNTTENQEKNNPDEANAPQTTSIQFVTKFDIVDLDANGHVIDRGDEDYQPSKAWQGRKAGFEFKRGERGLGYYRTGKKVVVPSNTAY